MTAPDPGPDYEAAVLGIALAILAVVALIGAGVAYYLVHGG